MAVHGRVLTVGTTTYRKRGPDWVVVTGRSWEPICGPRITELLDYIADRDPTPTLAEGEG